MKSSWPNLKWKHKNFISKKKPKEKDKKKKNFYFPLFPYRYYLKKRFKKLQNSNFFSYYRIKLEFEILKRLRFDGLGIKFLKHLNSAFYALKYDFFLDPLYVLLLHVECLSLPIFLHKKWSKRVMIPLDKMYKLYVGFRVKSLYRGSKMFLSGFLALKKGKVLYLKIYKEFIGLHVFNIAVSLNFLEKSLIGMFVNKRNVYF